MALIVETGEGVPGANSYLTASSATALLALRGRDAWVALPTGDQEEHLIDAADYLNATYGWGVPLLDAQTMGLPTVKIPTVPAQVRLAQALLADEARAGRLVATSTAGAVTKERKKLDGVGEKEVEYATASGGLTFPLIDGLLSTIGVFRAGVGSAIEVVQRVYG